MREAKPMRNPIYTILITPAIAICVESIRWVRTTLWSHLNFLVRAVMLTHLTAVGSSAVHKSIPLA